MSIEQDLQKILEHQDAQAAVIQPKLAKIMKLSRKKKAPPIKSLADLKLALK